MIHTNAIIIAATLNTIRYSISLFHCLTGDETGSVGFGYDAVDAHGTGMPPPIAIAARVRLSVAYP